MPALMRKRNESAVYYEQCLDLTRTLPFVEQWNRDHSVPLTVFDIIVAGCGRALYARPGLNRFVAGGRIYQRRDVIELLRAATNAAVAMALLLAAAKMATILFSGSVALLASALDSALDGSASLLNALAVRYALRPPDSDHRFGHGRSEALAGVAQALFITRVLVCS